MHCLPDSTPRCDSERPGATGAPGTSGVSRETWRYVAEPAETATPQRGSQPVARRLPNPSGQCLCGCGLRTPRAPQTRSDRGWIKGEHVRFAKPAHARRYYAQLRPAPTCERCGRSVSRRQHRYCRWCANLGKRHVGRKMSIPSPLKGRTRGPEPRLFAADYLPAMRAWAAAHGGRAPSLNEWRRTRPPGSCSAFVFIRDYGSWVAAVSAAGLTPLRSRWDIEAARSEMESRAYSKARQMVSARSLSDALPGTVKHFA